MTIDEKAKAYDEALKKIQSLYEQAKRDDNPIWSTYEHLFPQLAESEEETTRKELLDFVRSFWADHKEKLPKVSRWVTYLEKQKEQNEELVYRLNGLMQDYIKEGKDDEEKEHRLKCYQLFWDALEDTNFFEQQEQKPAWSEEDTLMLTAIIQTLDRQEHFTIPWDFIFCEPLFRLVNGELYIVL